MRDGVEWVGMEFEGRSRASLLSYEFKVWSVAGFFVGWPVVSPSRVSVEHFGMELEARSRALY
jgi:hypothetical protein